MLHHPQITHAHAANACDLSPHIPDSFTPALLEALIGEARKVQISHRANPVDTSGTGSMVMLGIENRQREAARVSAIISCAYTLLEPEEFDIDDLELAASDLAAWLDEDSGRLERAAHAKARAA